MICYCFRCPGNNGKFPKFEWATDQQSLTGVTTAGTAAEAQETVNKDLIKNTISLALAARA